VVPTPKERIASNRAIHKKRSLLLSHFHLRAKFPLAGARCFTGSNGGIWWRIIFSGSNWGIWWRIIFLRLVPIIEHIFYQDFIQPNFENNH
jgi:hypothetical protein